VCCLAAISDLLIALQLPEVANTAWGYALASAAAEAALEDLGFSRNDFAEVHGCPRLTKARFVQRWKANGGAQTSQKKRPPPPRQGGFGDAMGKQQKVQFETASGWQQGGGSGSREQLLHGGGAPAPAPPPQVEHHPPRMSLGGGGFFGGLKPKGPRREYSTALHYCS
jgi:hypothetical protein